MEIQYADVVGTDDVSQFRGWAVYIYRDTPILGGLLHAHSVKKLWIDFWN